MDPNNSLKKSEGIGVSETLLKDEAYLMSGHEAIECIQRALKKATYLKTWVLILEHVLMERVTLEELNTIKELVLNANYDTVLKKQAMFFEILMHSMNYLTLYILMKLWKKWIHQGKISGLQTLNLLRSVLDKLEGTSPIFRLKIEYTLHHCHSHLQVPKRFFYYTRWLCDMEELKDYEDTHRHSQPNRKDDRPVISRLTTFMKKWLTASNKLPSRLLLERLSMCLEWIQRLSEPADEEIYVHILSTLAHIKHVCHVLPRKGICHYLSSCAHLKEIDHLPDWAAVCEELLKQSPSDWLEEEVLLEALEYYARHTGYPQVLVELLQKHEKITMRLRSRLIATKEEVNILLLDWTCYSHAIAMFQRVTPPNYDEESILFRWKQLIQTKKNRADIYELQRLAHELEILLEELKSSISS
jgi:hypothetical protein